MSTGKVNETIRSFTEEATAGVLSLTNTIDKKTAHFVLRQKHSITTQSYLVGNNRKKNCRTLSSYLKNSMCQWIESLT